MNALIAFALLVANLLATGFCIGRWAQIRLTSKWALLGVLGSLAFVLLGTEMCLLGHLHAWTRLSLAIMTLVWTMLAALIYQAMPPDSREVSAGFAWNKRSKFVSALVAIVIGTVFLSGFRPPHAADEIGYHLTAPMLWAQAGHWIPYKLVNGPALMEWLYTLAAIFNSSTAAHWTHSLSLLLLLAGCAGLASSCGSAPLVAIAACLACPSILGQSSICYNDLAMGALLVNAYAALWCSPASKDAVFPCSRTNSVLSGALLAGAFLIKPIAVAAIPVAAAYAALPRTWQGQWKASALRLLLIVLPTVIACALSMAHTYAVVGKLFDPTRTPYIGSIPANPQWDKVYFARDPADPMLQTGAATGRIPTPADLAVLPVVPLITSVLGQREPYGGRTGLLLAVFAPLGFIAALNQYRKLKTQESRKALLLSLAAATYFLLLGPFFIKTRFHIFVWAALSCIAAVGFTFIDRRTTRLAQLGVAMFFLLGLIGVADGIHRLIQ